MALVKSILLSATLISLPLPAIAANASTSEIQSWDHVAAVKELLAVNGLGQSNKTAVEDFKKRLLAEVTSDGKATLTPDMKARFDAISTPICNRILTRLNDYTVNAFAPRLTPTEVEQLIRINTSPLGAKFISTMTSPQSFDHDKFDTFVEATGDEIVSAIKTQQTYTVVSFTYAPGSPAETARRVFDMTGNRGGTAAAVDDYFVYSILAAVDADMSLSAMSEAQSTHLQSLIFIGKLSLVNRMEDHFVRHLTGNFSHDDLRELTELYDTPVVLRASDAVRATQKGLAEEIDSAFKSGRTEFLSRYKATH